MNTSEYKVLSAEIENFKGIRHRVVKLDGKSVYVFGGNGKGKSSIIDALISPIDSRFVPASPINIHAEDQRGTIRLSVGSKSKGIVYDINVVFTPKNRTGTITLFMNGEEVKGGVKTKIKQIFGDISFDIYEFMRMTLQEKIKVLKRLTGCEEKLDELDSKRKVLVEERTFLDKTIANQTAVNDKEYRPFSPEDIKKYESRVDVAEIQKELEGMKPAIDTWSRINNGVKDSERKIVDFQRQVESLENKTSQNNEEIKRLEQKIKEIIEENERCTIAIDAIKENNDKEKSIHARGIEWLSKNACPDTASVAEKMSQANEHNRMFDIIAKYRERHAEIIKNKKERDLKHLEILDIDNQKKHLIANSQLPVDDLTFDENNIYLGGIPLESGQVNTQKILDVAAEISMAINNDLRLVIIREASLFDKEHLNSLIKRINERGYQWIAEVVDPDGGDVEIKFQEEDL